MPALLSTSSLKRTVALIFGGVTVAVLVTWLFNRRRKSQKSLPSTDEIETVINMSSRNLNGSKSASVSRGGRRNYRQEQKQNHILPEENSDIGQLLPLHSDSMIMSWSEEVERMVNLKLDDQNRQKDNDQQILQLQQLQQQKQQQHRSNINCLHSIESPSIASIHSEASADSGRATGGIASSMSPVEEICDIELPPMYEFEIPNTLVGLIIGIKGKTIRELSEKADVKMIIRQHHNEGRSLTHQLCTVEGKRESINKCLQMLRRRFPPSRFPDLNLKPVLPPPIPSPVSEMFGTQPTPLTLPDSVRCEVVLSSMVDAGHFFLQQPTHPSFASLQLLDKYMLAIYCQTTGIPELPKPCETGLLCVAPVMEGWYRAVTVVYYEEHDEVLVRFVDYGGYSRIPRADLRQIRTDFMTLPFQASETYLAGVVPKNGAKSWSDEANQLFQQLAMSRVIVADIVDYHPDDKTPMVLLYTTDSNGQDVEINRLLVNREVADLVAID